jgi:hypothetical protein
MKARVETSGSSGRSQDGAVIDVKDIRIDLNCRKPRTIRVKDYGHAQSGKLEQTAATHLIHYVLRPSPGNARNCFSERRRCPLDRVVSETRALLSTFPK